MCSRLGVHIRTCSVATVDKVLEERRKGMGGPLVQLPRMQSHSNDNGAQQAYTRAEDQAAGEVISLDRLCHACTTNKNHIWS